MVFKKLHLGSLNFSSESLEEISAELAAFYGKAPVRGSQGAILKEQFAGPKRVYDAVSALALCHNVTPNVEFVEGAAHYTYQAASPDEVALVKFTESVGLRLHQRSLNSITIMNANDDEEVKSTSQQKGKM
jgi:phospholipid-translocating ATPase